MREVPSKSEYQPITDYEDGRAMETSSLQPNRYRDHMRYSRNTDQFFCDIYNYHQLGGFWAVLLAELLWCIKFVFVVFVGIELTTCTRWDTLTNSSVSMQQWSDVFIPPGQCWATLPLLPALLVTAAIVGLLIQLLRAGMRLQRYWETRLFCTYILNMPSSVTGLADMTWAEVQKRLIQSHQSASSDELAVYHRILRHVNYLIAMIDQDVLPIRFNLPVTQPAWNYVFLPESYLFNLKLLLFRSPWSPFSHSWQLQPEYKEITRRHELAAQLGKMSRILGLLNLLFAPVILLAQLLVFICSNAERIRYHPGSILGRRWSNYAHLYLRHYNELTHQFVVRVGLAYEPACKYLDSFISRSLIAVAETVAFVVGSASVAFFVLGLVHDQVMHLPGYWAILVIGGLLARACLSYIPDENAIHSPQALLVTILGKIHRVRDDWIEYGATSRVRLEFAQLFQYRISAACEDLISAIVTPFLLLFVVPNHTLEIVDFLRNYTVEMKELGDVCSFAQLDVRRHGDPQWKFFDGSPTRDDDDDDDDEAGHGPHRGDTRATRHKSGEPIDSQHITGTWGKTELSLMHFHLNNPECPLPAASRAYLQSIRQQLLQDMQQPPLPSPSDPANQRGDPMDSANVTRLLSSLYGQASMLSPLGATMQQQQQHVQGLVSPIHSTLCNTTGQLKNVSHLPGPSYINENNMGFVSAMAESMRNSLHRSDPGQTRSSLSDNTRMDDNTTGAHSRGQSTPTAGVNDTNNPTIAGTSTSFQAPISMDSRMLSSNNDPINMSVMAASALVSTNASAHPTYRPYTSVMENGCSQNWGLGTSSMFFGPSSTPHGLTDMLTADTSASILYMHELAHRRRLQQSGTSTIMTSGLSASQSRPMGRSHMGAFGDQHSSGAFTPYAFTTNGSGGNTSAGVGMGLNRPYQTANYMPPTNRDRHNRPAYGSITSHTEPVGVVRASGPDARRIVRPRVAEVAEEEDELAGTTPRAAADSGFRGFHYTPEETLPTATRHSPAGVVTVSSPSLRSNLSRPTGPVAMGAPGTNSPVVATGAVGVRLVGPEFVPPDLSDDTVGDHVWPDLPPTNC